MKKSIISIGTVVALVTAMFLGSFALAPKEVLAEGEVTTNTVSVSGVGSITVKPDIAYITVGVETENADAATAQQENASKMTEVLKAIKEAGIEEDDIKTLNYSIYDRYNYNEGKENEKYYVVSNSVKVTIRDIDKVGDIIDVTAKAGSNQISNISFGISDDSEVYAEALKLAMASAKVKANAIMSTFGKEATIPSKVTESSSFSGVIRNDYAMMEMAEKSSFSTPVSTGELTITANVSVEYNY